MRFLERQRELQVGSYGEDPAELEGQPLADFVIWNVVAATDELHEALHEVKGWKPWSTRQPSSLLSAEEREDFVEELVDALHFLGNLFLAAGVDDDELWAKYHGKAAVNAERQVEGYDR